MIDPKDYLEFDEYMKACELNNEDLTEAQDHWNECWNKYSEN